MSRILQIIKSFDPLLFVLYGMVAFLLLVLGKYIYLIGPYTSQMWLEVLGISARSTIVSDKWSILLLAVTLMAQNAPTYVANKVKNVRSSERVRRKSK